jgi:hypothetical protein
VIALYTGDSAAALREFNEQLSFEINPLNKIDDDARVLFTRRNIAHSLLQLGRNAEALVQLRSIESTQINLFKSEQHGDLAYTRLLLGEALIRNNELAAASVALTRARDALLAKRGANHWAVMLADAYLALVIAAQNPSAAPSATALLLAERVQRELGWQHGAPELAARLKGRSQSTLMTVPAIL